MRESLCTLLEMEGFHTLSACTPAEALVHLHDASPPLAALVDGDLPDGGAATFLESWAKGPSSRVPILALAEDRGQARREPLSRATSQLIKPVRLEALLATLGKVLGRRRARELREQQRSLTMELPL